MKKIIIIGAGGLAREVAVLIKDINMATPPLDRYDLIGFLDDDETKIGNELHNIPILTSLSKMINSKEGRDYVYCIGIGNAHHRRNIHAMVYQSDLQLQRLIHPQTIVDMKQNRIDKGAVITGFCHITTDCTIHRNVYININSTVGHGTVIMQDTVIQPGCNISGNVTIGKHCEIGTGTKIIQGINICDDVIIGAGAVVIRDITEPGTYIGIPAKKMRDEH